MKSVRKVFKWDSIYIFKFDGNVGSLFFTDKVTFGRRKVLCIRIEAGIYILVLHAVMFAFLLFSHLHVTLISSVCNYICNERNCRDKLSTFVSALLDTFKRRTYTKLKHGGTLL